MKGERVVDKKLAADSRQHLTAGTQQDVTTYCRNSAGASRMWQFYCRN